MILCKERADREPPHAPRFGAMIEAGMREIARVYTTFSSGACPARDAGWVPVREENASKQKWKDHAMRLMIEIAAAALLVICISVSSAAYAGSRSADGLSCSFSVAKNASPAARCAAIKRQCGGKFFANYCGDKLLSAM
jgi:hypothetical protein